MTAVTDERRVTMVDYGGSNMRSVQKAFEAVGVAIEVTSDPEVARRAVRLVLPGVGHGFACAGRRATYSDAATSATWRAILDALAA